MKHSFFAAGALLAAATAFGQSGPATSRPAPPAPPRTDAPGTPINPQQNSVSEPAAAAPAAAVPAESVSAAQPAATPAAPTATPVATPPAAEPAPAPPAARELVFAEADTDKDGRLSVNEYTTFVESRMQNRSIHSVREETIQRFLDLDQNNDAFLSEFEASSPPMAAPAPQSVQAPRRRN